MRPNYAQDAPPTKISVGGNPYKCNVDFRTWIEITHLMRDIITDSDNPDHMRHNAEVLEEMQMLAFGGVLIDETANDVLEAMVKFSEGYPAAPRNGAADDGPPLYSLEWDINYIVIAIRNQSGIDLSYRRKEPFHWWEFLLEFQTLCGNHYVLHLIEARNYKGKDKDLLKRKRACALPAEYTAEERAAMDAFNAMFEGGK